MESRLSPDKVRFKYIGEHSDLLFKDFQREENVDLDFTLHLNNSEKKIKIHKYLLPRISSVLNNLYADLGSLEDKINSIEEYDAIYLLIKCFYQGKDFNSSIFKNLNEFKFFMIFYDKYDIKFLSVQSTLSPHNLKNIFQDYNLSPDIVKQLISNYKVVRLWKLNVAAAKKEARKLETDEEFYSKNVWTFVKNTGICLYPEQLVGFIHAAKEWARCIDGEVKGMVEETNEIQITNSLLNKVLIISPLDRDPTHPWGSMLPTGFLESDLNTLSANKEKEDHYQEWLEHRDNLYFSSIADTDPNYKHYADKAPTMQRIRFFESNYPAKNWKYFVLCDGESEEGFYTADFLLGMKTYFEFSGLPEIFGKLQGENGPVSFRYKS